MGANFVLQKPVTQVSATRCLNTAINFMASERRRYFRQPVEMPTTLTFAQGAEMKATMTNLSDGGMAIYFRGNFPKGAISRISFQLEGVSGAVECKGQIAWMDGTGRAGIRFTEMPKTHREQLQQWLGHKTVPE